MTVLAAQKQKYKRGSLMSDKGVVRGILWMVR